MADTGTEKTDEMDEAQDTYVADDLYDGDEIDINVGVSPTCEMESSPPRVEKMEADESAALRSQPAPTSPWPCDRSGSGSRLPRSQLAPSLPRPRAAAVAVSELAAGAAYRADRRSGHRTAVTASSSTAEAAR